ncbi:MAG: hypothetical protein HY812_04080 [Planctomycetes bacterium]|nr:hypothetical protein [Planctomycetota bacterium]
MLPTSIFGLPTRGGAAALSESNEPGELGARIVKLEADVASLAKAAGRSRAGGLWHPAVTFLVGLAMGFFLAFGILKELHRLFTVLLPVAAALLVYVPFYSWARRGGGP